MNDYMISTSDNPYNPWTDFDSWYAFDEAKGYHTCSYLARVCRTSQELSEADENEALNTAIDEICELNLTGNYIKVANPMAKK